MKLILGLLVLTLVSGAQASGNGFERKVIGTETNQLSPEALAKLDKKLQEACPMASRLSDRAVVRIDSVEASFETIDQGQVDVISRVILSLPSEDQEPRAQIEAVVFEYAISNPAIENPEVKFNTIPEACY